MGYKVLELFTDLQRLMNGIVDNLNDKGVEVYMDDIVVRRKTEREHDRLLKKSYETFRRE